MAKRVIDELTPIKLKKGVKLERDDSVEYFKNKEYVVEGLAQAIMDGDSEAFRDIFAAWLAVINKEELARKSKIPIATIRRMAAGHNFNIDSMLKVTAAIKKYMAA